MNPNRFERSLKIYFFKIFGQRVSNNYENMQQGHLGGFLKTNTVKYQGCPQVLLQLGMLPATLHIPTPIMFWTCVTKDLIYSIQVRSPVASTYTSMREVPLTNYD